MNFPKLLEGDVCPKCKIGLLYSSTYTKPKDGEELNCDHCLAVFPIGDRWKRVINK